jgi:hypothetical protein
MIELGGWTISFICEVRWGTGLFRKQGLESWRCKKGSLKIRWRSCTRTQKVSVPPCRVDGMNQVLGLGEVPDDVPISRLANWRGINRWFPFSSAFTFDLLVAPCRAWSLHRYFTAVQVSSCCSSTQSRQLSHFPLLCSLSLQVQVEMVYPRVVYSRN